MKEYANVILAVHGFSNAGDRTRLYDGSITTRHALDAVAFRADS